MQELTPTLDYLTECFETKAPELINYLYRQGKALAQQYGLDEDTANRLGVALGTSVAQDFGGSNLYIPKSILLPLSGRDLAIFNEFNGHNHRALAKKHGVSEQWVYNIIKRITKEEQAKRQMDMFNS